MPSVIGSTPPSNKEEEDCFTIQCSLKENIPFKDFNSNKSSNVFLLLQLQICHDISGSLIYFDDIINRIDAFTSAKFQCWVNSSGTDSYMKCKSSDSEFCLCSDIRSGNRFKREWFENVSTSPIFTNASTEATFNVTTTAKPEGFEMNEILAEIFDEKHLMFLLGGGGTAGIMALVIIKITKCWCHAKKKIRKLKKKNDKLKKEINENHCNVQVNSV